MASQFQETHQKKRTTRGLVVLLSSRTAKIKRWLKLGYAPEFSFKFDLEKVVQNKTEQRTKFSMSTILEGHIPKQRLFCVTCEGTGTT